MSENLEAIAKDKALMQSWMADSRSQDFEPQLVPGPGIQKLNLHFDIEPRNLS